MNVNAWGVGLLAFVGYTYVGYPVLVAIWAKVLPKPIRPRPGFEPSVSVCIAVHNGAEYLQQKLESVQALEYPSHKLEILLFSDGSTDDTERLTQELAARDPRIRLLTSSTRLGKPSGINRLREAATGEVLLMTDIRQPLAPHALRALLEPLSDPDVGCVSGMLVLIGDTGPGAYWLYERFIRTSEARVGGMVGVSGSLYAIRKDDLQELPTDVLLDDMFVPLSTVGKHKRIALSVEAEAHDHALADDREFGRKVRTLAGNYQLLAKLPWLLVPLRNPVWFQLVSHKLLRLLCPFALLGLLLVSGLLATSNELSGIAHGFWQTLLLGQVAFYGLAALGARAGRLGSLARTFVVLNAAALLGLWRFLRGSQQVAW